jgi:hypothetical protein
MKEFATALAKLQAEIGAAHKSSTNPHFKSKYADLSEVWETWREVGPKHGFSLLQSTRVLENGTPALITILLHESGQSVQGEYPLIPTKQDPQGYGSAMTYARRYCLAAMVGIVQEDDDGNAATKPAEKPKKPEPAKPPSVDNWIEAQRAVLSGVRAHEEYNLWRNSNKAALAKLASEYPDKYEVLEVFIDGLRANWSEAF